MVNKDQTNMTVGAWAEAMEVLRYSCGQDERFCEGRSLIYSLALLRGSRGPSTVTLIALLYVHTCGGLVAIVIVRLKLFPKIKIKLNS